VAHLCRECAEDERSRGLYEITEEEANTERPHKEREQRRRERDISDPAPAENGYLRIGKMRKIRASLARLTAAPRDALTSLEIGRLQSLIGQTRSAERYIDRAVKSAPNDRYVLRSAARFWAHLSKSNDAQVTRALDAIWASDIVRVDPWVQAAEVAIASICGKTPRWGVKTGKTLLNSEPPFVEFSELASSLATLELHAGGSLKKARKLTRLSLRAPTENAVAQAMSSRRQIGVEFDIQGFLKLPNASEVRARAAYDAEDYETSADECWSWLEDENFSARAAQTGAFVNSCLLARYDRSLAFAEQGLQANPSQPILMNSRIFALAYLGRVDEARRCLPSLEIYEHNRKIRPFVNAARGLLAFRSGDFMSGRLHYHRAVEECQEIGVASLAANATIYWLEQELHAGTADLQEANQVIARLDDFYKRDAKGAGKSAVWNARKKQINKLMAQAIKLESARRAVEKVRSDWPLLTS
jgi:hypothetical protein